MDAWKHFLEVQKKELGEQVIQQWLEPLKILSFDARNLYLEAEDMFQSSWFEEHMRDKASKLLVNNNKKPIIVHLSVADLPIKEKKRKGKVSRITEAYHSPYSISFENLDPYCSFSHFHISDANNITGRIFAHISGSSVDEDCKTLDKFNPIYVHGGKGVGKSHLLMATAKALRDRGVNALYVRTQAFTEHLVSAIRSAEMSSFRQAYRSSDVLIVDDVHVLSRKSTTQEEFFHTFNALHSEGKQIILSSNCPPSELEHIEPRLVSRFEWGIVLSLEAPSRKDMLMILSAKSAAMDFPLHVKVKDYLVDSFLTPAGINKALETLVLRAHLDKSKTVQALTVQMAEELLKDLLHEERLSELTPVGIVKHVAEHFGILQQDILGKAQTRECVLPRQIAMYLCRSQLKMPYMKIGDIFKKDHSTVMSSVVLIQKGIDSDDKQIHGSYRSIMRKINRPF